MFDKLFVLFHEIAMVVAAAGFIDSALVLNTLMKSKTFKLFIGG